MGHWDPKSSSVSHCSISSLCEGCCAAFTLSDSPVDPQWLLPHQTQIPPHFLTLSRLQTGSLYMTADFSNTSPLSSLTPKLHPIHGSDILRLLLSPPTSQGQNSLSLSTFYWSRGSTVLCSSFRSRATVSPVFFYFSGHSFGLFYFPFRSCTV